MLPQTIAALFKEVVVEIAHKNILSSSGSNFAISQFFAQTVNTSLECKKAQAGAGLYFWPPTSDGNQESTNDATATVKKEFIGTSANIHFRLQLQYGIFGKPVYLPVTLPAKIRLECNDAEYIFMKPATNDVNYIYDLSKLDFEIKTVKVSPAVAQSVARNFMSKPIRLKYSDLGVRTYNIGTSAGRSYTVHNVELSKIPNQLYVGFIDSARYNGVWTHHPFIFAQNHVQRIEFICNSKLHTSHDMKDKNQRLLTYSRFMQTLGKTLAFI